MVIDVYYPSGYAFWLTGEWIGPLLQHGTIPAVFIEQGPSIVAGDPRGIYVARTPDARTEVLYHPRMVPPEQHGQVFRDWLAEHPEWPEEAFDVIESN